MELGIRIELINKSFADSSLANWVTKRKKVVAGAGFEPAHARL